MKEFFALISLICLVIASLYSYICNDPSIFVMFAGLEFICLIAVYIGARYLNDNNLENYHSAHSI